MPKVTLINPSGREVEVDEESVPYLTRLNYREKSHEEIRAQAGEESKTEYYDTVGQKLKAFGEGVAAGATLNLSDVAFDDEATRERAQRHAGLRTGGEIVGAIIPALATGGESVAARLLSANPAGLVERGAEKLAGSFVKSRTAKLAVSGAAEGFAGGVGQNVAAGLMGDPITSEAVVSSIGLGTLLGGGLGFTAGKIANKLDKGIDPGGAKLGSISSDVEKRLQGFEMPDVHEPVKLEASPQVVEFNARIGEAKQRAKDYLDQRIHKGEWFVQEADRMGNDQVLDFQRRFDEAGGKQKMLDELDRDIIASLDPKEREAYLSLRKLQVRTSDEEAFKIARNELEKTGPIRPIKKPAGKAEGTPPEGVSLTEDVGFLQDERNEALQAIVGRERATQITQSLGIQNEFVLDAAGKPGVKFAPSGNLSSGRKHPGVFSELPPRKADTVVENLRGVREHGGTELSGPPSILHGAGEEPELGLLQNQLPEYQAADVANQKLAGYYIAKQMIDKMPDLSYEALAKMSSKDAVLHSYDFFERMHQLAPDVAKHFDDALAGAFGSSGIVPAELATQFKLSQDTIEKLGNAGAAKNFAAAWSTVKGMSSVPKELPDVGATLRKAITDAEGEVAKAPTPETKPAKAARETPGMLGKMARVAAGRKGYAVGGAVGYALGWGVVDSLLMGGLLNGAGGRIANMSRTMAKKALTLTGKALIGKGRGLAASYVGVHEALATPYAADESPTELKGKSEQELFKLRRNQATKMQGQYAIDAAAQTLAPVAEHSPELAQKLRDHVVAKANYLANAVPQDPPWAAFDKHYQVPKEEIQRFATVHRAVNNPMSVLEDLASGYLDPVAAEAFRATSPELHSQVSQFIFNNVDFSELDYNQGLNTSIFLGVSVNADLASTADFQASFLDEEPGQGGQAQAQAASALNISFNEEATDAQRADRG